MDQLDSVSAYGQFRCDKLTDKQIKPQKRAAVHVGYPTKWTCIFFIARDARLLLSLKTFKATLFSTDHYGPFSLHGAPGPNDFSHLLYFLSEKKKEKWIWKSCLSWIQRSHDKINWIICYYYLVINCFFGPKQGVPQLAKKLQFV